jgi:hypothetical protein
MPLCRKRTCHTCVGSHTAFMLSSTSKSSVRLADGQMVGIDDILSLGQPGIVALAGATVAVDASAEDLADIAALPNTIGDDTVDVLAGAYNIASNRDLLCYPNPWCFTDRPAIVVGSGPSLPDHLETVRRHARTHLIVAAVSAVRPLIDAGIWPHVVAPKERIVHPDWCVQGCPSSVLYAGLSLVPRLHALFDNRLAVGDGSNLAIWSGTYCPYAPGPLSGTHAIGMALALTSGPVYLVGMDSCGGHCTGYQGSDTPASDMALCYDGQYRPSSWIYRIGRANIARKHAGRCVQVAACAAVIPGVPLGVVTETYTEPLSIPLQRPTLWRRRQRLCANLRALSQDLERFAARAASTACIADTHLSWMDSENKVLFEALLAPTVAQLSMERRCGMRDVDVVEWYREATANIVSMIRPTIDQMVSMGHDDE